MLSSLMRMQEPLDTRRQTQIEGPALKLFGSSDNHINNVMNGGEDDDDDDDDIISGEEEEHDGVKGSSRTH